MRYILGHRARSNRTPTGSALFSVTPTFLLPLRRRHLRRRAPLHHGLTLFPVARKRNPAWRFLQCREERTGCLSAGRGLKGRQSCLVH